MDQGCPLSPALFALALAPKLAALELHLRARDDRARVYAYLDDIFIVCDAAESEAAVEGVRAALGELAMPINAAKTKVWSPDPNVPLPPPMERFRVGCMTCLGTVLPFMPSGRSADGADDAEVSRTPLLGATPGDAHLCHLQGGQAAHPCAAGGRPLGTGGIDLAPEICKWRRRPPSAR